MKKLLPLCLLLLAGCATHKKCRIDAAQIWKMYDQQCRETTYWFQVSTNQAMILKWSEMTNRVNKENIKMLMDSLNQCRSNKFNSNWKQL